MSGIHTPESKEQATITRKKLWNDPKWSTEMKKKLKASWNTPEVNEKKRIAAKAMWADPVIRAKRIEINKKAAATRKRRHLEKLERKVGVEPT